MYHKIDFTDCILYTKFFILCHSLFFVFWKFRFFKHFPENHHLIIFVEYVFEESNKMLDFIPIINNFHRKTAKDIFEITKMGHFECTNSPNCNLVDFVTQKCPVLLRLLWSKNIFPFYIYDQKLFSKKGNVENEKRKWKNHNYNFKIWFKKKKRHLNKNKFFKTKGKHCKTDCKFLKHLFFS